MPGMDPDGPITTTMHPVLEPEMKPSTVEKPLTDKQQHALDLAKLRRHGRSAGEFNVDPDTLHGRRCIDNAVILTYTANRAYVDGAS